MSEQTVVSGKRYFMYKNSKAVACVSANNEEELSTILDHVDEGACFEVTKKIEVQEKYNQLEVLIKENCSYCGECENCEELIYMGDELHFENQVIDSTLLLSNYRPV